MYFDVEQIDRGIYNAIRLELVRIGRLPDAEGMTKTQYFTERSNMNLITKVIECYPVANYDERDLWAQNCIVVDRVEENPGEFGGSFITFEENTLGPAYGPTLDKKASPSSTTDVNYIVRFITQIQEMETIMSRAIRNAIQRHKPIFGLNLDMSKTTYPFRTQEIGTIDVSSERFIEKGFRYVVKNVYLTPATVVEVVPKMTDFEIVTEPIKSIQQ